MLNISVKQKDFAHELPEMVFQDQFVAINVGNISPSDSILKKNRWLQVSGKEESHR